jgi:nicotinamidase-related amidase
VGKHRVNALYATGLDLALRANDIRDLVILGYATSGVILSTVRYAADLDYNLYVVEDCCSDSDVDVHDFLINRILPRQADIVQSDDVIQALGAL